MHAVRRLVLCAVFLLATNLTAATRNWTGTTSGKWSVPSNWGGVAPVAGDDLVFGLTPVNLQMTNDLPPNTSFNSLFFNGFLTQSVVSGNAFLLGAGGVTESNTGGWFPRVGITLTSSQTWALSSAVFNAYGDPSIDGNLIPLDLGNHFLTISTGGMHFYNTVIGTGGITISGADVGALIHGRLNCTGPTTINGPALVVVQTPHPILSPIVVNNGGTLQLAADDPTLLGSSLTVNGGGKLLLRSTPDPYQYATFKFAQVIAEGNITLVGNLDAEWDLLKSGQMVTILSTHNGMINGTFAGLPDGAQFVTYHGTGQALTIHYTSTTVTLSAPVTTAPTLSSTVLLVLAVALALVALTRIR